MSITHNANLIGDDLETALNTLVPATLATVSQVPPTQGGGMEELLKVVTDAEMPAAYLFQPDGTGADGVSAQFAGLAENGTFVTDLPWAIFWIQKRTQAQDPAKDLFWPMYRAIWDALLDDFTRDGNAFGTYPQSFAHSGTRHDGYITAAIALITPMQWEHA